MNKQLHRVHPNSLPESVDWRDDGCDVSPRCLDCPLTVCKYDMHWQVDTRDERNAMIRTLQPQIGTGATARRMGVSTRTVHRVIAGVGVVGIPRDRIDGLLRLLEYIRRSG